MQIRNVSRDNMGRSDLSQMFKWILAYSLDRYSEFVFFKVQEISKMYPSNIRGTFFGILGLLNYSPWERLFEAGLMEG